MESALAQIDTTNAAEVVAAVKPILKVSSALV